MNLIDLLDPDHDGYRSRAIRDEREVRSGVCDDDVERTAPYIGVCPDESDHEDGSPLDFGNEDQTSAGNYYTANERRWQDEQRKVDRQKLRIEHGLCNRMTIR